MATHGAQGASSRTARLPEAVPMDLPALSRLSWELGSRVVSDATLVDEWEHRPSDRRLAIYEVTDHTVVLTVRTPVGRSRFYGAAKTDCLAEHDRLEDATDWERCE